MANKKKKVSRRREERMNQLKPLMKVNLKQWISTKNPKFWKKLSQSTFDIFTRGNSRRVADLNSLFTFRSNNNNNTNEEALFSCVWNI